MATILARRARALVQARTFVVLCALLALLLPAAWVAAGIYVLRTRVVQEMGAASAAAGSNFDALFARIAKAMAEFDAADARATNRISLTARMLRIEAGLAPAESLFLYDAQGRFVAATVPLLPGQEVIRQRAWFRTAEAGSRADGLMLLGPARQPLGDGEGLILARRLAGPGGTFAGAIGTFLDLASIRPLLSPAELPPGSTVELRRAEGEAVLQFSVPDGLRNGTFWSQFAGAIGVPAVAATIALPHGLEWRATASALSEMTTAEARALDWGAALLAAGPILLLTVVGRRRRGGRRRQEETADPAPAARDPEPDWMWEINAEGRLVGVAGNVPGPLVGAVGRSLFDLVADAPQSKALRDAMVRRMPLRGVTIGVVLAGDADGTARQFSLSGYPVEVTGGFWGTAKEIPAPTMGGLGPLDQPPDAAGASVQAGAESASAPSMRPSSVRPRRHASALSWTALM